ncbi:MAG: ATP-dependent helicase [Tannerella sp.]|nr:ATP-dependent helicase [Tannerella sp.]
MQLNDAQNAFIDHAGNFIRLLAPAGAGKTASLLYRCVKIVKDDPSRRILIVTFTRVARAVLQERITNAPEFSNLRGKVEVATLNSLGYKTVKNEHPRIKIVDNSQRANTFYHSMQPIWSKAKYERIQKMMTSNYLNRSKELFDTIDSFKELGFDDDSDVEHFAAQFSFLIDAKVRFFKNKLEYLCSKEFITKVAFDSWDIQKIIENLWVRWYPFFSEFSQELYKQEFITLNDQKYRANDFLQGKVKDNVLPRKGNAFSDVFVDEFQDVSPLDLMFIKTLVQYNRANLVIVGDDDQAIFEFRGASPQFIIDPDQYFDGQFTTFTLGINYRSPKNIVDISQKLIVHNLNRVKKEVSTSSVGNAEIQIMEMGVPSEVFEYIMHQVKTDLAGNSHKRIALVARKRSQLLPYQVLFAKENIDYFTPDDLNVFLANAFAELKFLLELKKRLLRHPDRISNSDIVALCNKIKEYPLKKTQKEELLGYLVKKITDKSATEIYFAINSCDLSFMTANSRKHKNPDRKLNFVCAEAVRDFLAAKTVAGVIRVFASQFEGFAQHFGKSEDDIFYTDPPFYHLIDFAEKYGDDFDEFLYDIEQAIEKAQAVCIRTDDATDNSQVNKPLHLTTALRIKGEEYDVVYVLDANDKIWPNIFAKEEDELEGERRLFYVATTRAREKLIFSYSVNVHSGWVAPSPYLGEMGLLGSGVEGKERNNDF